LSFPLYGPGGSEDSLKLGLSPLGRPSASAVEPFASVLAKAESASEPQKEPEAPKPARSAEEPAPRQGKAGQAGSPRDAEKAEAAQTAALRSEPQRALPGDKVRDNKSSADSGGTKPTLNQASARPDQAAKSGGHQAGRIRPRRQGREKARGRGAQGKQPSLSNKRPALELARGKAEKTDEKAASLGPEEAKRPGQG